VQPPLTRAPLNATEPAPAKDVVMRLVDELGFDPVDAGGLGESWRQQPGSPVYGTDFDADGVRRALAQAKPNRTPDWSAPVERAAPHIASV
jgi:predicted dinucleotide-binding enzyme